ncbi:AraC family transcriptional regulator [Pseudomonas japonica]|uniref:AraC family transcriptional regulator n=1 Tax=Pseudomonas japonica TaxID=256466 RepID=UPI0015E45FA7|nr:AraC family transcriptional regulator [Pseudomonas japonica]MBA1245422.1 AraC family transcriptional regulator [Pseudomonas japonica]
MLTLLSERSRVFERADAHAVSDYVNQHVGTHCIRLPPTGRPEASIRHRTFASLDLCRISYGGAVRVTSTALGTSYHLQILLRGHCTSRAGAIEHTYVPGEMLLINPDDPVDLTYSQDCEKFILRLPVSVLERACLGQSRAVPTTGIRFGQARHDLAHHSEFAGLLDLICREAEGYALEGIPVLYERIVAGKLLGLLANNAWHAPLASPGASVFDTLSEYIDAHVSEEIGLERLLKVAGVSERTLYSLFERKAGVSPREYIRQRKLDCVHQRLQHPATHSVTQAALDIGFLHLGRFAETYRKRFGELPSHTWKRHHETAP